MPWSLFRAEQLERARECVREAADQWARQGRSALSEDLVLAVLARVLSSPVAFRSLSGGQGTPLFSMAALPARPLQEWASAVGTALGECSRLAPDTHSDPPEIVVDALLRCLAAAADEWALGNPEEPPTEAVFLRLAHTLDEHGYLPWWGEVPGARPPGSGVE